MISRGIGRESFPEEEGLVSLEVAEEEAGLRLDRLLSLRQEDLTRSAAEKLIAGGSVLLNGKLAFHNGIILLPFQNVKHAFHRWVLLCEI